MRVVAVSLAAAMLTGCASMPDQQKTDLLAAAVGAGAGALIGSSIPTTGPGAIIVGAVVGGAAGGIIGAYITPRGCFFRNARGELWRVPCEVTPPKSKACYIGSPGALEEVECPYGLSYR